MSMQAVGLYLRGLREKQSYTQAEVARRIGVAPKTIERWEAGKNEPSLTDLRLYIEFVNGSIEQVVYLLIGKEITLNDAELAAIARLSPEKKRLALELIDQLGKIP